MRNACLHVKGSNDRVPLLGTGPWLLGRDGHCDIHLDDPACDLEQVLISLDDDDYLLEPLSRSVPTLLNQRVLTQAIDLHDGDGITFGRCQITFEVRHVRRSLNREGQTNRIQLADRTVLGQVGEGIDIPLDHPNVSLRHAIIERDHRTAIIRDLGTPHGTFVNSQRIRSEPLSFGDTIDIGPFSFRFVGDALEARHRSGDTDLIVSHVSRELDLATGKRLILDDVSLQIKPRELVCIVGKSGSGKSTLMNIISGRNAPDGGIVTLDGRDLHRNFEVLKSDIAFVPQQDVLHEPLRLREALTYAARLRLPDGTPAARRTEIVEDAARSVELLDKLDTPIASLSGGQKKRASLASELLAKPGLLFLDEVTSGLDESTDREIMALLRKMAEDGTTIVCVTHTLANIETFAHRVIVMGEGGVLGFSGTPVAALEFFGVARLGEMFERMDVDGARAWSTQHAAVREEVPAVARASGSAPSAKRLTVSQACRQLLVLNSRNALLLLRDTRMLALAGAQTLLIGILVGYVFSDLGGAAVASESNLALLRLLAMVSIWLGCNSAATQIVSELPIYRRERDVNLSEISFVLSKFLVSAAFAVTQLLGVLALVVLIGKGVPGGLFGQILPLVLSALVGTALGLTISSLSTSRDQASTIVPLAIVPQLTLGAGLVPILPDLARDLRDTAISVYWTLEALKAGYIEANGPVRTFLAASGRMGELASKSRAEALAMLVTHISVLLCAVYAIIHIRFGRGKT